MGITENGGVALAPITDDMRAETEALVQAIRADLARAESYGKLVGTTRTHTGRIALPEAVIGDIGIPAGPPQAALRAHP